MRNYLVKRNNEGNDLDFLDDAFNRFFKGLGGFPKFKKKTLTAKSFEVP